MQACRAQGGRHRLTLQATARVAVCNTAICACLFGLAALFNCARCMCLPLILNVTHASRCDLLPAASARQVLLLRVARACCGCKLPVFVV
eukprot:6181749-Pleurochrysis_carterae.AAC.1